MSDPTKKAQSKYKQYFSRTTKRNEELDKNRAEPLGNATVEPPNRRSNRETLKGRRDLTVLPHSKTPLFGFEDETDTGGTDFRTMPNSQDLQNFNSGVGDAHAGEMMTGADFTTPGWNIGLNNLNTQGPPHREIPSQTNPPEGQFSNQHVNIPSSLDPTTANLVKDLIVKVQKETMSDMMKNLTNVFKETLRIETQAIMRQVTSSSSSAGPQPNGADDAGLAGDQSQFRLGYRDPVNNQNQFDQNPNLHEQNRNYFQGRPQNAYFEDPRVNVRNHYQPNAEQANHAPYNFPQRVQLDKWGFQFNGSNMSVEDFLFRVECKQNTSNYSWAEVYSDFNNLLSGPAEHWYWNFRKNRPQADYNAFKLALAERYPSKESDIDLWRKLMYRKQKPGESFDDFVDDIERIYYKMGDQPTNQQLISVIRGNVSSDIATYIGLNRTNSMVALKHMAREAEKLATKLNPGQRNKSYSKHVSEVSEPDFCENPEDHIFVEAFSAQRREYKIFQCKRCSQKFRVDEESKEEKRIYCYGCGKEGVIKSNCPVCSENRRISE